MLPLALLFCMLDSEFSWLVGRGFCHWHGIALVPPEGIGKAPLGFSVWALGCGGGAGIGERAEKKLRVAFLS